MAPIAHFTAPAFVLANLVVLGVACSTAGPDAPSANSGPEDNPESLGPAAWTPAPAPASGSDAVVSPPNAAPAITGAGNAMLVLGHWSEEGRRARAILACKAMQDTPLTFDKIVVSGGCKWVCHRDSQGKADGCYVSDPSIGTVKPACGPLEAVDLENKLESLCGISRDIVETESESSNTEDNYCKSRRFLNLAQGSSLYVVSSHFHAFSVASCYSKLLPGVDVHYYYTCDNNSAPPTQIYLTSNSKNDPSQGSKCCAGSEIGQCGGGSVIDIGNVTSPICTGPAPTPTSQPIGTYPCHKDYNTLAYKCDAGTACSSR